MLGSFLQTLENYCSSLSLSQLTFDCVSIRLKDKASKNQRKLDNIEHRAACFTKSSMEINSSITGLVYFMSSGGGD